MREPGAADKAAVVRAAAEALEQTGEPVTLRIVPFVPGRRPEDEAAHPGLGSSENVALILPAGEHDVAHLLYDAGAGAPGAVSGLFADQDGLYGSACTQYRDSMNDVAHWAKQHGLMDHTGEECVPRQVSLLEAHVNQPARVALLQHHDGYGLRLEVGAELPETYQRPVAEIQTLLAGVPILAVLEPDEQRELAHAARPLTLAPTERLVVQGEEGGSLFVLADGEVEVFLRGDDGEDVLVDTMGKGAFVGEMSLLTGEPRTATVRARDGAVVYEIGARQYAPVLRAHPELVDVLAQLMFDRLRERRRFLDTRQAENEHATIVRQIRYALFRT